ncbi:hypothetical protein K503DRAFT_774409 [Rhizopogon vinicolor AM-OR11-026]|uniref:Uncharacterized protein n=1 Tax=Rhizopogon vinicolor AM-OR11-026 TaxID=1314800 RepID=A0A1B7MPN5_9AGAM|nr:hypothetical protein K503DRAFT_774409 [Rhizopogon vinicolor AM-OR11-026]
MELPSGAYRAVDVNSRLFLCILLTLFPMISGLTQSVPELSDRLHNLEGASNDMRRISMTVSICPTLYVHMMYYHDGLRIITAERARHSSILSGTPS